MGTGTKVMIGLGAVLVVGTVGYLIYNASTKDSGSTATLTAAQQAELDKQNRNNNLINAGVTLASGIINSFMNKDKQAEA